MSGFTVYLYVRASADADLTVATERRLQALQVLRDELVAQGVRVTALPDHADLEVDIINVFGASDAAPLGGVCRGAGGGGGRRAMIIRLSIGDDHLDVVCSDGVGHGSAEHHAAKRILGWLNSLERGKDGRAVPRSRELTTNLSTRS